MMGMACRPGVEGGVLPRKYSLTSSEPGPANPVLSMPLKALSSSYVAGTMSTVLPSCLTRAHVTR